MESTDESGGFALIRDNVVVRLLVYYALAYAFFWLLDLLFPIVVDYMNAERLREMVGTPPFGEAAGQEFAERLSGPGDILRPERVIPVLVSMLGALALALPVAWVYTWTRPDNKTRQAVAQALVILPIAIALVVFLVKGSLALAFSLAGIVAAVRFRTSLSDTTDAVFLFVVIGIGLSAGVQLLSVSFIASLFFNVVALAVWQTRFAESPSRLVGLRLQRADSRGHVPETQPSSTWASSSVDLAPQEILVTIHTTTPEQAVRLADLVFARHAKSWRINRTTQGSEGGASAVEFSVRLRKRTESEVVLNEIREAGGASVVRVESVP